MRNLCFSVTISTSPPYIKACFVDNGGLDIQTSSLYAFGLVLCNVALPCCQTSDNKSI